MTLSRRRFLQAGGLGALGLGLGIFRGRRVEAVSPATDGLRASVFLLIQGDGRVEVACARSEMGQGVRSSLPVLIADELGADLARVTVVQADGDAAYGNQNTDSSSSVRGAFDDLRRVGATARVMLTKVAADEWQVAPASCVARDHAIHHAPTKRSLSFAQLVGRAATLAVPRDKDVRLRPLGELPHLGKDAPLYDAPAFVTGSARFAADVTLPGLLVAVIARPPALFDGVDAYDATAALQIPGVRKIVKLDGPDPSGAGFHPLGGVAVLAEHTWAALQGRAALQITWKAGANRAYDSVAYRAALLAAVRAPGRVERKTGDVDRALQSAARVVSAEYTVPHLAQAPMEPPAALASFADGRCEIWACTQDPQGARREVAGALSIPPRDVTIHVTFLGGGFGRKSKPDFLVEAALLSRAAGAPVRVQWTRSDDLQHGYYHTVSAQRLDAGLTADGRIVAWRHRTAFPSISSTFASRRRSPTAGELAQGAVDVPFAVPNFVVEAGEATGHARIGWMRSVCNLFHAFAVGSFVDELAAATTRDPRATWLALLGPPRQVTAKELGTKVENYGASLEEHPIDTGRLRNVIERVTASAGFVGQRVVDGHAFGLAAHRSFLAYVAVVAKVSARGERPFAVDEVWICIDAGRVINADRVRAQMEGAVIFGLSLFLHGAITMKRGAVEQSNFRDYRLARIGDAPQAIHVDIVPSEHAPGGVGEPGVPPVAPALANALYALTNTRLRDLPWGHSLLSK